MTNPPDGPPDDGGTPPVDQPAGNDEMETTPPRQKKAGPKGPVLIEKTVKFRFTRVNQHDSIDPSTLHLHWVQIVQEALKTDIQVFTNNGGIMPPVDLMRWTSVQHSQQYKVHFQQKKNEGYNRDHSTSQPPSRSPAAFIMHRIRSTSTITSIRNLPRVQKFLRENGVYLTEHRWPEDVWDISQQGFMLGIDPQFYSPTQAHERISHALKKALTVTAPSMRIPKFAVAFCTPQVNLNSTTVKTKAYAIETEKSKAVEMQRVLKEACKKTNDFVPFHLRAKHPEAFSRYIQQHTKILSQNHTIVLNYIGNQSILYLEENIRAVPGVIDLVPSQSVELDGKFRVQVRKDDFYKVRSDLAKRVPKWYEELVPDDAKQEMRKFPSPPEVAPLASDGYSSSSDGYMTASIATAMSYTSGVSILTTESQLEASAKRHAQNKAHNQAQKTPAWSTPPPTLIRAPDTDAGLISELESSKSEVEALKQEMLKMKEEKQAEIKEIESKAEQQRVETVEREKAQRIEMEERVEAQRLEFKQQLEDQRKALEEQHRKSQCEMEASFQRQIAQAIQSHLSPPVPPTTSSPSTDEVNRRMETQDARIQQLTDMIQQLVTRSPLEARPTTVRASTGKRLASQAVIDLTVDHDTGDSASHQSSLLYQDQEAKKRDIKETPRQNLAGNLSIKMERTGSPAPSDLSMSMMDPPASQTAESLLWGGIHPPSEVYSPPAPPRPHRMGLGHSSPMSNLALHPNFRSPGNDYLFEDAVRTADQDADEVTEPTFDESNYGESHMRDIHAQHLGRQGFRIHHGNAESPQGAEPKPANGPPEDDSGANQATPVDGSPMKKKHEGAQ